MAYSGECDSDAWNNPVAAPKKNVAKFDTYSLMQKKQTISANLTHLSLPEPGPASAARPHVISNNQTSKRVIDRFRGDVCIIGGGVVPQVNEL